MSCMIFEEAEVEDVLQVAQGATDFKGVNIL
jgi:hypothetical protein